MGEGTELFHWLTAPLDMPGEPPDPNLCQLAMSDIQITSDMCRCSSDLKQSWGGTL